MQLHSVLAVADLRVTEPPGSFPGLIVPIPHPTPGSPVGIVRSVCRIHSVGQRAIGLYATAWFLLRASDLSIIGAVATDTIEDVGHELSADPIATFSDRDIDWRPDFFFLGGNDAMFGVFRTFALPRAKPPEGFDVRLDILYAFTKLNADGSLAEVPPPPSPRFVQVEVLRGDAVLGLKSDGSVWTATVGPDGTPLVWISRS